MTTKKPTTTKYRVTMKTAGYSPDGKTALELEAVDYVPEDILEQYVTDAATRWATVEVSDKPDFGPGGPNGDTHIPDHLNTQQPTTQEK